MSESFIGQEENKLKQCLIQIKRSFAITKKDLKIYYNKPPVIIQGILFPIILFFAMTIGRNVKGIYLISGMMAMIIFLTSTSIGPIVFPWETMRRTFERLITCPISIKTILLGSVWSSFIHGMIFALVPLILGVVFLPTLLTLNFLPLILGLLIAGLAFASFGLILSVPSTDTPGNTMILTILIKFPLIFISPLFMPILLTPITLISPLTYFIDIINVGIGEISVFGAYGLLIDLLYLIGFGTFCLALAFILHAKTLERRFQS